MVTLASAQSQVKLRAADKDQAGARRGRRLRDPQHRDPEPTYCHCTDEEAEDYSEHPKQPLGVGGGGLK